MQKEQVAIRLPVELDGSPSWSALLAASRPKWAQPLFSSTTAQLKADTYELIASLRPTTLVLLMAWVIPSPPVLCVYRGRSTQHIEFLALSV